MKQVLVSIPVVGYAEYIVEVEEDVELPDVGILVSQGDIELPYTPGVTAIIDWILVDNLSLWNSQTPECWPKEVEVEYL